MGDAFAGDVQVNKVESNAEPALVVQRRSAIKLAKEPHIVICMPVGDKSDDTELDCPKCKAHIVEKGIRARGLVALQWATNHMQLVPPLNCSMSYMFEYGRLAAEAREVLTHNALKTGCKYIFYWDDDTIIPPLALYEMHNFLETHPDVGAVTGVYCTREIATQPIVYKQHGEGAYWGFEAGEHSEPEEIFSAGAGCLLVRTEAIKKMKVPYWSDAQEMQERSSDGPASRIVWGHDVRFCVKLKTEAEMPLYLMGSILCGHWDIYKQTMFELPSDSPPMRRWRHLQWRDYWNETWGQRRIEMAPKHPGVYSWIADRIDEGARVADLGCGVGVLLQKLIMRKACDVVGYDASMQAVAFAEQLDLPVKELDLRNLTREHIQHADAVVATFVLEWVSDAIRERILTTASKEGADFYFAVEPGQANKLTPKALAKLVAPYYGEFELEKIDKMLVGVCRQPKLKETNGESSWEEPNLSRYGLKHDSAVDAGSLAT